MCLWHTTVNVSYFHIELALQCAYTVSQTSDTLNDICINVCSCSFECLTFAKSYNIQEMLTHYRYTVLSLTWFSQTPENNNKRTNHWNYFDTNFEPDMKVQFNKP